MAEKINFSQKWIVVTGGADGIGWALSREFAKKGARLVLGGLPSQEELLQQRKQELEQEHCARVATVALDLLTPDGPERFYELSTEAAENNVFALVNNAGTVAYGYFHQTDWQRQKATCLLNFYVPLALMRLFLPDMVARKAGAIFNISSVAGLQPTPFQAVYGATKAALQSLSQAVNAELSGTGVRVCTLNPPYIDTNLLKGDYPPDLRFYSISGKQSTEWLARKAIEAFEEGRFMYVPGLSPKIIHLFMNRVFPRRAIDAVSRYMLQGWKTKP
ncbi:MAG: SDR family NAD(P)-dependent oxidoreductase [Thermodesulfobacteriota bacterium]